MSVSTNHIVHVSDGVAGMVKHGLLSARAPNWLPLPNLVDQEELEAEPVIVDEHDNFPKGTVEAWYPEQGVGFVKTNHGIVVKFLQNIVSFVGQKDHPSYLKAGARVGYDLGITAEGARIYKLKIY